MGTRPRPGTPLVERPDHALERSSHEQFGDACEMYICARLTWAGNPTLKVPDNWPDYDLIAKRPTGELQTISVKGNRAGNGKRAAWVRFRPEGWNWLACVRIDVVTEQPEIFLIPCAVAVAASSARRGGLRELSYTTMRRTPAAYRDNFTLDPSPGAATKEKRS
jgi:hypothetical protein